MRHTTQTREHRGRAVGGCLKIERPHNDVKLILYTIQGLVESKRTTSPALFAFPAETAHRYQLPYPKTLPFDKEKEIHTFPVQLHLVRSKDLTVAYAGRQKRWLMTNTMYEQLHHTDKPLDSPD